MDDLAGREEAERRAFAVMGTVRVLELGAERAILDLPAAIAKLQSTSFYLPSACIRGPGNARARCHQKTADVASPV